MQLAVIQTLVRRLRFYSELIFTGNAGYARYLLEMRLRGIDLGWRSVGDLGLPVDRAHAHADSGGPALAAVIRKLQLSSESAVLDLGCGKGGAMITFARSGFKQVDGVELSPDLCNIARRNFAKLGINNTRIFQCDASEFRDLEVYNVVYMFNPFPAKVVDAVIRNLSRSVERRPRPFSLVYLNPTCEELVLEGPFKRNRKFILGKHAVHVYQPTTSPDPSSRQEVTSTHSRPLVVRKSGALRCE